MRLPAITPEQIKHEASRERHEAWYQAFLDGGRVTYRTSPLDCEAFRHNLSDRSRGFWRQRGFLVHTSISPDKTALSVWLEAMGQKVKAA